MRQRELFKNISALDYRYYDGEAAEYLCEDAYTKRKLEVEVALVEVLARRGLCPPSVVADIKQACAKVTTDEVYDEEARIKHDLRALVNRICFHCEDEASRRYVHMTATSYDIISTAEALRYMAVTDRVLLPALCKLHAALIELAEREADTIQIGRTHGQHALPMTFGFAMAQYVSRLGHSIELLRELMHGLHAKFSGAVGAYNASSLFVKDPERFEEDVITELGPISVAEISTQIAPPEPLMRLLAEMVVVSGIMGNLARDMRNLQRTEIAEVGEPYDETSQVGSSTMPQKHNPIGFENIESMWKILKGRLVTVYDDQISEHQRDLTSSASSRTYVEIPAYVIYAAKRLAGLMGKLEVNRHRLGKNIAMTHGLIAAEPFQLLLASLGHPHAHEAVRKLTLKAMANERPLYETATTDPDIGIYIDRMTPEQRFILANPEAYTGNAAQKARAVATYWKLKLHHE